MPKYCLVILLICLTLSCKNQNDSSDNTLRIASLKGPSAITLLHMMDQVKELDNHEINYQILSEPNQVRSLLIQEKIDLALIPTNMGAILYNKDVPYKLAMITGWGNLFLCGQDQSISTISDLKGKRIYSMARGLSPDITLRFLITEAGLTPDQDVIIDYSFPTHIDLANAVRANRAPLAILPEPFLSMVILDNTSIGTLINLNEIWEEATGNGLPLTALMVHNSLISRPDLLNQILEQITISGNKATSELTKTAKLGVQYKILPTEEALILSIPRSGINPLRGEKMVKAVNSYLEVFYSFNPKSVGGEIPDENFFFAK